MLKLRKTANQWLLFRTLFDRNESSDIWITISIRFSHFLSLQMLIEFFYFDFFQFLGGKSPFQQMNILQFTRTHLFAISLLIYMLSLFTSLFFSKCETLGKDINMLSHHSYDLMQSSMIGIYSFPWHFVCLGRKCWAKRVTFIRFFKLKQVLGKKWYHQRVCLICLTL